MEDVTLVGIDLGKHSFHLHGQDRHGKAVFRKKIITQPLDGRPATRSNGGTIGFTCKSAAEVDLWHAVGVAHGGRSVENPPGVRDAEGGSLYLAYLRDPDDNKLSALYREPC